MEEIPFVWLHDELYNKYLGLLRLQYNAVMRPFMMYGQDALIPGAIEQLLILAEIFCMNVRGVEEPLSLEYAMDKLEKRRVK